MAKEIKQIPLRLSVDTYGKILQKAKNKGLSVVAYIRMVLTEEVSKNEKGN